MPMSRPSALRATAAAVLIGPTVLAFESGGYFDQARLVALIVAWVLAAAAVALGAPPLPRSTPGRIALGALVAYTGWIALSGGWSPLPGDAANDAQRALLYVGALIAAIATLRTPIRARAAELVLTTGAVVTVGYGLVARLLPGIITEAPDRAAAGRLAQPLTYWNAVGAVAAIAFTLCARIAGDAARPRGVRCAAAGAAAPMLAALYLTFSRGAIVAVVAGVIVLTVLAPTWAQLRATAITLEVGLLAVLAAGATGPVRTLNAGLSSRESAGAVVLVALAALMVLAAALTAWSIRDERDGAGRRGALPLPPWAGRAAAVLVVAIVVVPVLAARESSAPQPQIGQTAQRLGSVSSNRYAYWKVAVRTGVRHPLAGVGASGFAVEWQRHRAISEAVHDAHSIELETFAELGLVGVALLAALFGGVALAARTARRADAALTAGPIAALVIWGLHSAIDWDWEMPALTLIAVVFAGVLIACSDAAVGDD